MFDFSIVTTWFDNFLRLTLGLGDFWSILIECIAVGIIILTVYALIAIVLIFMERKVCAYFQCRLGPMRVGPWGIFQVFADVLKMLIKEIFTIDKASITMPWDDFEMEMIDGGAEEIDQDEEEVMITTAFEDFGALSHKLDELKIEAKSAELQRIANNTKEVSEEQFKANMKMLERFEEDDDVQNVYHNMELTEEFMKEN